MAKRQEKQLLTQDPTPEQEAPHSSNGYNQAILGIMSQEQQQNDQSTAPGEPLIKR